MEEYNNASFKHDLLDASDESRRKSYRRNNARNRDLYSNAQAIGFIKHVDRTYLEEFFENTQRTDLSEEDIWIEQLDNFERRKNGQDTSDCS